MNIMVLNGSPKKKGGASRLFSKLLKSMLLGCNVTTYDVFNSKKGEEVLQYLPKADAVVLSVPLYVDGIPAHLLPFLKQAEEHCKRENCQFKLYVISNNGFVEGKQNARHLRMYEAWCNRAGVAWGGGLGIGGGVMLHVLSILLPFEILLRTVQIAMAFFKGLLTTQIVGQHAFRVAISLFFLMGWLICTGVMAHAVKKGNVMKNMYTRPLIPSFLFIFFADVFMMLSALLHGVLPHKVFHKVKEIPPFEET